MANILIVDDEKNILSSFKKILKDEHNVLTASSGEEGLSLFVSAAPDLVIMDIRMAGASGLDTLKKMKTHDAKPPVIMMTAYSTTETAIEAMKFGAYDYVLKPFEVKPLVELINSALDASRLMKTKVSYDTQDLAGSEERIIGSSAKMQGVFKLIGQVAAQDITVLLRGESGTGKELVARAIYQHSKRKAGPFLVVNCAALPETLLESELFGYEKGAFTGASCRRIGKFEQAQGGTIFLDEIGDMSQVTQAKVLRVLQDGAFERLGGNEFIKTDVRIIAATNKNLEVMLKEGKFREDLYYRINVVTITLPPLRERREDIAQLAEYFLRRFSQEFRKDIARISKDALEILSAYNWPGNVRELENALKKAAILCKADVLLPDDISLDFKADIGFFAPTDFEEAVKGLVNKFFEEGAEKLKGRIYHELIEKVECAMIISALNITERNQQKAAELLGISRPTLRDKIGRLGIKTL